MGTTSDKLTYLNGTKQALKDSINALGGDITSETTFRNYVTELDTIYDNLPKTTGEGSNLSLTTLKGRINVDDILGDTEQDTTLGYNIAPVNTSSYTLGENDISITGGGNGATLFDNISLTANTTYYLKFVVLQKPTTSTTFSTYIDGTPADNIGFLNFNDSSVGVVLTKTYTPTSNVILKVREWGNSKNELIKFQYWITTDNTKNTYEPYTNGASPNPTYPQDINVVTGTQEVVVQNRNLANNNTLVVGYMDATGVWVPSTEFRSTDFIPVQENETYVASFFDNTGNRIKALVYATFDKDKNFIEQKTTASLTIASGVKYIRCRNYQSENSYIVANNFKYQVELGSTASSYVEHQEQTKTLHLSSKNLFDGIMEQNGINGAIGENEILAIRIRSNNYTKVSATQYTLSIKETGFQTFVYCYDKDKNYLGITAGAWSDIPYTFNPLTNTVYIRFTMRKPDNSSISPINVSEIQLEKGSSATTYEPYYKYELSKIGTYQDRIFETSGKNKLKNNATTQTIKGVTFTKYDDGSVKVSGTATSNIQYDLLTSNDNIQISSGNYYLSGCPNGGTGETYRLVIGVNGTLYGEYGSGRTLTLNSGVLTSYIYLANGTSVNNLIYKPMLNEGSTALPYEPYGSDKWYIEKNIGKVVFNGSETGWGTQNDVFCIEINDILTQSYEQRSIIVLSNYFLGAITAYRGGMSNLTIAKTIDGGKPKQLGIRYDALNNVVDDFKTWLSTHNTEVYYVMETPTYEEITNTSLIEELNELEKMMSYNGQTNISVSGNLPMILDVTALKGESE